MSPVHAFPNEDLYLPQLSGSFQQSDSYQQSDSFQENVEEVTATPPKPKKRATRARQKKFLVDAPRQLSWTTEEEIALCKAWVFISENIVKGNNRNDDGFWGAILQYFESKTNTFGKRTYDSIDGKWKTIRPACVRFSGVYSRGPESGARDAYYFNRALLNYEAETDTNFDFFIVGRFEKIFNTESGNASINRAVRDEDEEEVHAIPRPIGRDQARKGKTTGSSSMNDDAFARLMVSEMGLQTERAIELQKEERKAFLELKRHEMEIRAEEKSWQQLNTDNNKKT
ncbi:hypothetical protein Tco_1212534 [Tanacetum coccineum]